MAIEVSYHETVSKLQEFAEFARGPFDRAEWYALLATGGCEPLIVTGRSAKRTVALPLMRGNDGLASLTNWFSFTWRPLGHTDYLVDEILTEIARDLRGRVAHLTLAPVPDEDGSAARLETAFRAGGWIVIREQSDENHVLRVEGRSFAEYWSYRPGKMRTTLKRKARKVDVEILTRFEEPAWADYRSIYEASWKPEEERADVLDAFARAEGEAGRIRLGIARADGSPVAAQFWTVENGTAYIHKLAHIEAAKPLSAGTTLSAALFEHAIDVDKVELVDFGTGSDAYKRDWMETVRPRYRLTCYDWRRPATWLPIAKALVRRLAPRNSRG
ncbi:GNAT family N-acetyltransferase [Qipengyuania proteolytica]|uniref:GNAT family N-acetyltransferase n=1 Tax=Qipengyuania proteolytica TaxID=2867239 RepID=UPI0031E552ED